jgi:hypothetical protein
MRAHHWLYLAPLLALAGLAAPTAADTAVTPSILAGVDLMSATVLQEKQSSFSGLGLRARLKPQSLVPNVELMPSIEYWRNSSTVTPYDIRATRKDATLAFDARYVFHPNGWEPYLGLGYGLHFLSSRVDAPGLGIHDESTSVIKGGLSALGGLSFGLTDRIDNFVELKYHHIPDYRQLKINWGLAVRL